ncbi:hypothetical protein SAMN04487897_10910 [Paenibacillus sp. yr247]|uniref:hypothetical protein n=1 Tax=Paenibacillus sp. yr247 TaxID=1761880 RepID=UPI000889A71E|nr:hypothetical protein [Paenibacillus sp. yr247]SDO14981.1 hypothetical protein SAMN04487897_10910 [Paenibacillus sp. yr247]
MEDQYEKDRLPQRMQDVLKIIGENAVLFRLYVMLTEFPEWSVYQNLEDKGCDIVLINSHKNPPHNKIRIEVKTRQRLHSTAKNAKSNPHFTLSEHENECDFLIAYWFDKNQYYIVPTEVLKPTKNKRKNLYKFIPTVESTKLYLNKWELIKELISEFQ